MNSSESSTKLAGWLCVLCAVCLQVQVTLFQSPTYLGLRLNLVDILVPFAGIAILITLFTKKSLWPQWKVAGFYYWLGVLSCLLLLAFVNTWISYGIFDRWAFVNKIAGWTVLMGILGLGGWIGANATQTQIETFLKLFFYFFLILLLGQIALLVFQSYEFSQQWIEKDRLVSFPIAGLMANRNAYAFLFLAALSLSTALHFFKPGVLNPACIHTLYFILPFFIIFNGSRAAMGITSVLLLVILFINGEQWKKTFLLILSLVLGSALFAGIFYNKTNELLILKASQYKILDASERIKYEGDDIRTTVLKDAIEMVQIHPFTGSGLGSVMLYQKEKHGKIINIIDCTPMWIFTEMGAIGLAVFGLFYLRVLQDSYGAYKDSDGLTRVFRLSFLYILFIFLVMSLVHEITYTRFIWFFMGLALALPVKTRLPE